MNISELTDSAVAAADVAGAALYLELIGATLGILVTVGGIMTASVRMVRRPLVEQIDRVAGDVQRQVEAVATDVTETRHLVRHHLGPNGDTPPLWGRVEALEVGGIPTQRVGGRRYYDPGKGDPPA